MSTITNTFWKHPFNIEVIDVQDRCLVIVQFGGGGKYHRTRRTYTKDKAKSLVTAIVKHCKSENFPWTDRMGDDMWKEFFPSLSVDY